MTKMGRITRSIRILIVPAIAVLLSCLDSLPVHERAIDRKDLVTRHNVINHCFDSLSSLTVGNGKFAMTVDATGLQSFPDHYRNGISLGTFSDWGWHSFPDSCRFRYEEILKEADFRGRKITYNVQWKEPERKRKATDHFRQNPHRLHLGLIGMEIIGRDGLPVKMKDIRQIDQELNGWEGTVVSSFSVEGKKVQVLTICHPESDLVSVRIRSCLVKQGKIRIKFSFAYPSGGHVDDGCDWNSPEKHQTLFSWDGKRAMIRRTLDSTRYCVSLQWNQKTVITAGAKHVLFLNPEKGRDVFEFSALFSPDEPDMEIPGFLEVRAVGRKSWKEFWSSGGAVDFSGSTDPRAHELERRIVLSQYLTRIQCAGLLPPQETGLTFNSWYGKFHLEMYWWHAVHFVLWNRPELTEKSLDWYSRIMPVAKSIARRQGFQGVRWPKMTGPDGMDSPSNVGSYLIWQQPHLIYLAELLYRHHPDSRTANRYREMVFETAAFMADYATVDKEDHSWHLGPWLIPAQERLPAETTIDPPFELAYWHWGLSTANAWRERAGLARSSLWDSVCVQLPPLAQKDSLYLSAASAPDTYTNLRYTGDHPVVLGVLGMLPLSPLADEKVMKKTFLHILNVWDWDSTWGWDYPLMAMTATRLGMPEKAVDALMMQLQKNTYIKNGHNYQDQRLRIYLPGNGGLLAAIAMMCAGYDGCMKENPGFPDDGTWKVKWEGLSRMP
jgi:hypothetical protein